MNQHALAQPHISADGQWRWDGNAWVPNHPTGHVPPPPMGPGHSDKKKWGMGAKVLVGLGAVGLVVAIASAGSDSDGGDPATKASEPRKVAAKRQAGNAADGATSGSAAAPATDNTTATANGPLAWGNWETVGPIEPKQGPFDTFELSIRVKNTGEAPDQGFFQATVLQKQRILTTYDCISADDIQPGAITTIDCLSADDFVPGWDEITLEDAI